MNIHGFGLSNMVEKVYPSLRFLPASPITHANPGNQLLGPILKQQAADKRMPPLSLLPSSEHAANSQTQVSTVTATLKPSLQSATRRPDPKSPIPHH